MKALFDFGVQFKEIEGGRMALQVWNMIVQAVFVLVEGSSGETKRSKAGLSVFETGQIRFINGRCRELATAYFARRGTGARSWATD